MKSSRTRPEASHKATNPTANDRSHSMAIYTHEDLVELLATIDADEERRIASTVVDLRTGEEIVALALGPVRSGRRTSH